MVSRTHKMADDDFVFQDESLFVYLKRSGYLYLGCGFLVLAAFFVLLWFTTTSYVSWKTDNSGGFGKPKFANDAQQLLQSMLIEASCDYQFYQGRHYLLCQKREKSISKDGFWRATSGLWEIERLNKPVIRQRSSKKSIGIGKEYNEPDLLSYKLHPVDERAVFITRYILDTQLMGQAIKGAEVGDILLQFAHRKK